MEKALKRSEELEKLVAGQASLVQDRQKRAAGNVFAVRDNDESDSAVWIGSNDRPMASFSPVRCLPEARAAQRPENLS